jgi:hypothetical protein
MAVTEEQTLPVFNQTQLAEAAAQVLVLSGRLLGDKAIDVQSVFSASGNGDVLYLGPESQVQDIQPLRMGPMTRFVLNKTNPMGGSAECFTETTRFRDGIVARRERFILDDEGRKVRITEEKKDYDSDYEQTGIKRASVRTILAMAKEAMANAEPKPDTDMDDPLKMNLMMGRERMALSQRAFIPIIGDLAAIAGGVVINRVPNISVDARVQLSICHYRMYSSGNTMDRVSNSVVFDGVNRETEVGARFVCEAYPLGDGDIAMVAASLVIDDRREGRPIRTKDAIIKDDIGLAVERKVQKGSEEPEIEGKFSGSLHTFRELAEKAVRIIMSDEEPNGTKRSN